MRSIMTSKKRRRHTPEQIIRKLAEGNELPRGGSGSRGGVPPSGVARRIDVASVARAVRRHEGQQTKRLKELEINARLKRLLADAELDKAMLELAEGNF